MSADVVIVAYSSEPTIAAAVKSVIDDPDVGRVVVVDNRSPDRSADIAEGLGASVIHNPVNSGFGAGCNLGASHCGGEWILFLNPDAIMAPGSLAGMLDYISARPGVAVVASEVRGSSDRPEPVRRRFPTWWRAFAEPGVAARWDEWHYRRAWGGGAGPVDWVSASAILVRRSAFESVKGFDESFFLYAEEIDFCARLRSSGFAIHWIPGCPSSHASGSSTGGLPAMGKEEWARGFRQYIAKHSERPVLTRTSLLMGLWARSLLWAGWGRPDYHQKWRAAAKAISADEGRVASQKVLRSTAGKRAMERSLRRAPLQGGPTGRRVHGETPWRPPKCRSALSRTYDQPEETP